MIFNLKLSTRKLTAFHPKEKSAVVTFLLKKNLQKQLKELTATLNLPEGWLTPDFINSDNDLLELTPMNKGILNLFIFLIEDPQKITTDYFRNQLALIPSRLAKSRVNSLQILMPEYEVFKNTFEEKEYFFRSIMEGIQLGNYDFNKYKSEKKKPRKLEVIYYANSTDLKKALNITGQLVDSVYFARDLVNEPAITLTPQELARRVKNKFKKSSVKVKTIGYDELKKLKMNAILSVGAGSSNKPLMILLHYKPAKALKKFAFVGKGVTYDSGGLSIKPTDHMAEMKADMAGAAVVIGSIDAAQKLNLPFEIYGVIPAVENLIGGNSYKPGDIVSTSSGKTIEVLNTDAEGRIILADALEFASRKNPDVIIDFATLTGASVVALGELMAGLFTKSDELREKLLLAGKKSYENLWALPFSDEYAKLLKSNIADIKNLGSRWGGAITAAKFLEFFVDENIDYAHIDIAGPALKNDFTNYWKKWNTGFGIRLMFEYLNSLKI